MTREELENFAFSMVALAEKYAEAYKNRTISDIIAKDMFRAALNGDN